MATKKISDLTLRSNFDDTCNVPVDDASQTWRATGAQIKAAMAAGLPDGSTLEASGSTIRVKDGGITSAKAGFTKPTIQKFTSGSGTYTTAAGAKWIRVRLVGGGGGGGGGGNAGGSAGGAGGASTFGSSLLSAGGGSGGSTWSSNLGGAGGTSSLGSGPIGVALPGGVGGTSSLFSGSAPASSGGQGGQSALGGAGGGGISGGSSTAGASNTGGGGGGGGNAPASNAGGGGGGGGGGFVDAIIASPSATYPYAVGAAGTNGSAGTSGGAGAAGGSGIVIVEEYYQ